MDNKTMSLFDWGSYGSDVTTQPSWVTLRGDGVDGEYVNNAIETELGKITLKDNENLTYSLMIGDKEAGKINVPEDQFLSNVSYDTANQNIVFTFNIEDRKESLSVSLANLVDTYVAGDGLLENDHVFSIDPDILANYVTTTTFDELHIPTKVSELENDESYVKVDELPTTVSSFDNDAQYITIESVPTKVSELENDANYATVSQLPVKLSDLEDDSDFITATSIPTKVSMLDNDAEYITIASVPTKVSDLENDEEYVKKNELETSVLTTVSDANYVTTEALPTSLTELTNDAGFITNADVPTKVSQLENDLQYVKVEELPTDHVTKSEIADFTKGATQSIADVFALSARLSALEDKVIAMSKTNIEIVDVETSDSDTINEPDKDIVLSGNVTENFNITAKSTELKNSTVSNNARIKVNGGDVVISGVNYEGAFPKVNGNAITSLNNVNDVIVKNTVFQENVSSYNGIEIGLNGSELPASVLIDNCQFNGTFSNIPVLIFGTQDNAVVNISNCKFGKVSNALHLSNKSNVHCTVNITNCDFTDFDTDLNYTGMILCQNYTSTSAADATEKNLFANDKITINLINCTIKGEKIVKPENMSDICGSRDAKQLIYVYNEKGGLVAYDVNRYPTLNIL